MKANASQRRTAPQVNLTPGIDRAVNQASKAVEQAADAVLKLTGKLFDFGLQQTKQVETTIGRGLRKGKKTLDQASQAVSGGVEIGFDAAKGAARITQQAASRSTRINKRAADGHIQNAGTTAKAAEGLVNDTLKQARELGKEVKSA
jgi:hypothetical protein